MPRHPTNMAQGPVYGASDANRDRSMGVDPAVVQARLPMIGRAVQMAPKHLAAEIARTSAAFFDNPDSDAAWTAYQRALKAALDHDDAQRRAA